MMKLVMLSLAVVTLVGAAIVGSSGERAKPVQAQPIGGAALANTMCVTLGSAFGGLSVLDAALNCGALNNQNGLTGMQTLVHCLRGFDADHNGTKDCLANSLTAFPVGSQQFRLNAEPILQVQPDEFALLDRDRNQVHLGQKYWIMAFVNDDFPVRFSTDVGQFQALGGANVGKDYFCDSASLDPDCDGDPTTKGDGVVVVQFLLDADSPTTGTIHMNLIQEGIGFPMTMDIVGQAESITVTPLFGKDTIQTGATPGTVGGCAGNACENADETDCNFAASVDGVLSANAQAEKAVAIVRALDNEGREVVGALLNWRLSNPNEAVPRSAAFTADGDYALAKAASSIGVAHAGVALPQTPTIDLGSTLGFGFPQFICGFLTPGDQTFYISFSEQLEQVAPGREDQYETLTIHVVGPAVTMQLTADPPEIDCTGQNTSKITATVANAKGEPVANGLDVNFEVLTLGTVAPSKSDTGGGVASATVTALKGASNTTADGQPTGVTVRVSAKGQIHRLFQRHADAHQKFDMVEKNIIVRCSGGPPPPAEQQARNAGAAAGAGSAPTGRITGPDTGSGGPDDAATSNVWLALAMLTTGGLVLAGAGAAAKRR